MNNNNATHPGDETSYIYVMVRKDITLEQQLVQVAHAAHEAGTYFGVQAQTPNLVLLEVETKEALERAAFKLQQEGIDHRLFFEPDYGLEHCALASAPLKDRKQRACFRHYPLYRHRN